MNTTWESDSFNTVYSIPSRNGIYKSKEFHGTGCKVVNMGELFGYDFISSQKMKRIELTDIEKGKYSIIDGDLLFARRSVVEEGSGKCSLVVNPNELTVFESSIIRVRLDHSKVYSKFYYYYFKSPQGRGSILSISTGVNVKGIRGSELCNLAVPLPPLPTQRKIAGILSAYDDLIQNNTRRIAILEEMAQRIYKEWFVDFKYPGHENDKLVDSELGMIPEGWEIGNISDLYTVKSGFAFRSNNMNNSGDYGIVKIKNIQSNYVDLNNIQYIARETVDQRAWNFKLSIGDLLIAMTGAQVGKVGIMLKAKGEYLLNQRVGKFFPIYGFNTTNQFIYQITKSVEFQTTIYNVAQGAAQPNISGQDIGNIKIILPRIELIGEFETLCNPLINEIILLDYQNNTLRQSRDLLLPKLISGKVDVSELDIDIGAES
ncbi:MAG: restriction endonuclease subunit S [Candidatus Marinimicrobia bacterium]|nr:restriction endonuclease subunit S [Candidatus Neomarinimicrobiota bacterium]